MATQPATTDPRPAPWAHLPQATRDAIDMAIAEALVAWIDQEAAALTRHPTPPQKGNAGE